MLSRLASWFRFYATPNPSSSPQQQLNLMHALTLAIKKADIDAIRTLLQTGLDVSWRNERGYGIVHIAVLNANEQNEARMLAIIELLVNHGADVNAFYIKDQYGPLTTAVRRKLPAIVAYLLTQGADCYLKIVPHNKTALDYAREFTDERGKKVLACFENDVRAQMEKNFV